MVFSKEEIKKKVLEALSTSLALNPQEIKEEARLRADLGMDSLDFLDFMFKIENLFQGKIKDDEFERLLKPDQSDNRAQSEFLTQEEIISLGDAIPEEVKKLKKIPRKDLFSYLTVGTLIRLVSQKING